MKITGYAEKNEFSSQSVHMVINENTSGDDRMHLNTRLQNILLKSENYIVNTSFGKYQSIISDLIIP